MKHLNPNTTAATAPRRRQTLFTVASLALLAMAAPGRLAARTYEGQEFADSLQLGGATLQLNGVGMRAVAHIKGYLCGLYLNRKAGTPEEVYANTGPKRVQLRILLNAGAEEFVKAINKSVQRNHSEAERAAMGDVVEQFNSRLQKVGAVKPRDLIDMDYVPGRGTSLSVNGRPIGEPIAGVELYQVLLRVFLGQRPADKRMKAGLLGQGAA